MGILRLTGKHIDGVSMLGTIIKKRGLSESTFDQDPKWVQNIYFEKTSSTTIFFRGDVGVSGGWVSCRPRSLRKCGLKTISWNSGLPRASS